MSSKIEKAEKNVAKLTLTVPTERFEEGMNYSYNKNKDKVNLPGFRKGKAPRSLIERQYGREFLMDDAIDFVFPDAYLEALKEHGLEPVARPEMDFVDYDKDDGLTVVVLVTLKPEVILGEYKGLTYTDYEIETDDAEIEAEIDKAREKNARIISVSGRPVENGDTAVIDYEGFVDGEPFAGGKAENHELIIGSHTFIDTFEEQLIGKNAGDSLEVSVKFPEDYHSEQLSGKPAVFKVTIKDVTTKELPVPDDDFAQDVSEFDTFEEYKNSVREKLNHQKERRKEHDIEAELIKKLSEGAEIDIPDIMVENQMSQMIMEFDNRLKMQGLDLSTFIKYSGKTGEEFRESYREAATNNVRARLVLEEIAKKEEINPTEEDVSGEIKKIAEAYGIEEDKVRQTMGEEDFDGLSTDIKTQRAIQIVKDSAVGEKKPKGE